MLVRLGVGGAAARRPTDEGERKERKGRPARGHRLAEREGGAAAGPAGYWAERGRRERKAVWAEEKRRGEGGGPTGCCPFLFLVLKIMLLNLEFWKEKWEGQNRKRT